MQIEDLILLALRILAVGLIALAMARPSIVSESVHLGQQQVGVVIALDGSYSMGHQPGVASRFDRGLEMVRQIEKTLSPGYPVSLVLMGDHPRMVLRNSVYDEQKFAKALKESRAPAGAAQRGTVPGAGGVAGGRGGATRRWSSATWSATARP